MNKFFFIFVASAVCVISSLLQANNLIPNPDFKTLDQQLPDGWTHFTGSAKTNPFHYEKGILSIREAAPNYVSSANVQIPLDGFKSYQWNVEMKLENVKKMAAIFYYWTDAVGNRITSERYLCKLNGNSGWQTISRMISPDDPARTHGIRICLAIYHDTDSPGQVLFRHPSLQIAGGDLVPASAPAAEKKGREIPVLSADAFSEKFNFIYKKSHESYQKFAGVPGFLSMSSSPAAREGAILKVRVPESVTLELQLLHGQSAEFQKLFTPEKIEQHNREKSILYRLPHGIIWNFVGNALFFNESAPLKEYSIHLDFEFAESERNFQREIRVQLRPRLPSPVPVSDFRLYSWYSYPVMRLNLAQETMGKDLMKLWQDCGYRGGNGTLDIPDWSGYQDISKVFHYRHKDGVSLPASETPDGHPGPLACLSALNDPNSGFLQSMAANARLNSSLKTNRLVYDYEPYAGGAGWVTRACFCTRCREDFAQQEKLPLLSAKEILTQHEQAWVQFRCRQRARFIQNIQTLIRKKDSAAEFYLCSMPLPPPAEAERFFKEYGIDLKLCEPFVDGHMPMNYSPSLDFYYRQLQMALDLQKPLYPVLDNGWGTAFHHQPERAHGQILASAFMGIKGVYFGSGLMRMDAAWLEMSHRAMTAINRFQPLLNESRIEQKTWTMQKGLFADGNVFSITRYQEKTGTWFLFTVNNSPRQTAFAQLLPEQNSGERLAENYAIEEFFSERQLWPDKTRQTFSKTELFREGIPLQLSPFACSLLICRPAESVLSSSGGLIDFAAAVREAESDLREQLANQYKPRSEFGMSSRMLAEGLQLQTPSQTLLVHLEEGAFATWSSANSGNLAQIGRDWFVEPEVLSLTDNRAELLDLKFTNTELQAEFRYQIHAPAYEGLILRKRYVMSRNKAAISVQIAIEPGSDYRPFRYRVGNLLNMDRDQSGSSYPDKIEYRVQGMNGDEISRFGHAIFIHPEAKLPESKPFFAQYAKAQTFTGHWLEAQHTLSKNRLRAEFNDVDQIFLWRSGQHATMEWIYADPYPDRDPHKVKTWNTEFTLEFIRQP